MTNPILQALGRNQQRQSNNLMAMASLLKSGNPDAVFNQMMQNNPQFAKFVNDNKGKSVDQIAQENGIDMNTVRQFMK